jgi:cytochrome c-type biogenesis protein CcmH/NrfG
VLAEYAQTLLPERPEDIFSDELVATLRRIHAIDSSHATARFFLGVVESRAGNAAAARAMWEPLLARLPQDSELAAELRKRIESLPTR